MLPVISNLICPLITLAIGVWSYRSMNKFWRLLFLQIVVYAITLLVSYIVTYYQKSHGQNENTLAVYNVYMLIEISILLAAAHVYFNTKVSKYLAFTGYGLFLVVFFIQIRQNNIYTFANYASATQSTVLTLFYGVILYQHFALHSASLLKEAEIWMCAGLLMFLAGCIPYITMINYMQKNYPKENYDRPRNQRIR